MEEPGGEACCLYLCRSCVLILTEVNQWHLHKY